MIRVQFCSNSVTMEGHAGYGKKGSDIVCAAVSTLLYVQVRLLEKQDKLRTCRIEPGHVVLLLRDGADVSVLEMGLRWLAGEYSQFVVIDNKL